jgi:UDP-glucose 4-epimerase
MKVLITGGAGYIGSVTVRRLLRDGHEVEILDNLSTGHAKALAPDIPFHQGSLLDADFLAQVFAGSFEAVIHFAAFSLVGESMADPLKYWRNNVGGSIGLLKAVAEAKVERFVFSSTAAVYGEPTEIPIVEDTILAPVNPYGETKLAMERALAASAEQSGLSAVALRYFNACGADDDLGEDHEPETHLIPRLLRSILDPDIDFKIFGDDYPTPDGTCIRDYIHVRDLAEAHALALEWADHSGLVSMNLGTESGLSVREVVDAAARISGQPLQPDIAPRRAGDPARLIASSERARSELGWAPQSSNLETIVRHAWEWHRRHPLGYNDRDERS